MCTYRRALQLVLCGGDGIYVYIYIIGKTLPVQVAEGQDHASWALVGAVCSSQFQVAQGQGLITVCVLVQAAVVCCSLLRLVPKLILILCKCASGVLPAIN